MNIFFPYNLLEFPVDDSQNETVFSDEEDDEQPFMEKVRIRMLIMVKIEVQGWY